MPHVRDDRDTPLLRAGMAETVNVIWGNREAEYFSREGWTDFRVRRFFCPTGKSLARKIDGKPRCLLAQISTSSSPGVRARANSESHFATATMMP
jgi:hypothetical protein